MSTVNSTIQPHRAASAPTDVHFRGNSLDVENHTVDLSVIVPVRNAQHFVTECLSSIKESGPRELIVVDGNSTDKTVAMALGFTDLVMSDEGEGVAAARLRGAHAATSASVALIDVDIVLGTGALEALFREFKDGGYTALQAGLLSESGPGYWGQALVFHHNNGRSKNWPGVMATIFKRDRLLEYGFDEWFASGEDIELRWRLRQGREKLGVSRSISVAHRFDDTFACALGQFTADGEGLARMVLKYRWPALKLLGIPAAGAVRGVALTLRKRQPKWIPYFVVYALVNYYAMARALLRLRKGPQTKLAN